MATQPPPPPPRRPRVVTLQPGAASRAEARLAAQMAGKAPPVYGRAPTLMTPAELKARRERLATNPLAPSPSPSPLSTNTTTTSATHLTQRTTLQGLGATGAATTSPSPTATERVTWWRRRAYLPVELYIAILTLVISAVNLGAIVWLVMRMRAMQ